MQNLLAQIIDIAAPRINQSVVKQCARASGLELVSYMDAQQANAVLREHSEYLRSWQDAGYSGEMGYMARPPELFADAANILPDVRSIVSFVVSYSRAERPNCPHGSGQIARYAWGLDYHKVLKKRLKHFISLVREHLAEPELLSYRLFTDAVPLLERALAEAVQNGFLGKNTMFIYPSIGSYTFLAEVLWNVELVDHAKALVVQQNETKGQCGTCERCNSHCPTGAFVRPGVIDGRKCISYLTIEKRGAFDDWERQAIGNWLFGCDICQDVCPFNHAGNTNESIPEFEPVEGVGANLALRDVLSISSVEEFKTQFQGTPLMRAGREQLLRNACAVAANSQYYEAGDLLARLAKTDESELVRAEAEAARERLRSPSINFRSNEAGRR